ncbi:MAG TPA: RDD family protein [Candidatus Acidoferrum sp.]|nr:RDD family protein [Candidatus Acidoferrum sp.]
MAPTRCIAGFWRRLLALVIDVVLISIPGFLLGSIFYDFFSHSSLWAAVLGLVITLPYFAILGSSIGEGQTLGHRCTGIEVVNGDGSHLSIGKSVLRYTILLLSLGFAGALLPAYMAYPVGMASITILYLYLFNIRTRQTLHDVATGSFVVKALGIGAVGEPRLWRGHWVALGALLTIAVIAISLLTRTRPFPELAAVQRSLIDSGQFQEVGVTLQTHYPGSKTDLHLIVKCKNRPADYDKAAKDIVTSVESVDPRASELDFISVDFKEGFNVGLATYSTTKRVSHTPSEWETIARAN